jgi:hypothetical protein
MSTNQIAMPTKQRLRPHQQTPSTTGRQQSAQPGQDRPVRGPQPRTNNLPSQDRDFVAEHDHLDRQLVRSAPLEPEQLKQANERQVQRVPQPILAVCQSPPKVQVVAVGRDSRHPQADNAAQGDATTQQQLASAQQQLSNDNQSWQTTYQDELSDADSYNTALGDCQSQGKAHLVVGGIIAGVGLFIALALYFLRRRKPGGPGPPVLVA